MPVDSPSAPRKTHLIVFFHGLHGVVNDFAYFVSQLNSDPSIDSLIIHSNETSYTSTLDGIDRGGIRAADEIQRHIDSDNNTALTHISLIGHSLGGLYARYTARVLHRRGVFERLKPTVFMTFGTPHCGSLQHFKLFKPVGVPTTVLSTIFTTAIGRTGQQLTFNDKDAMDDDDERHVQLNAANQKGSSPNSTSHHSSSHDSSSDKNNAAHDYVPLLVRMSQPHYTRSLLLFDRRVLYANINGDFSVHFCTAAITHANPYKSIHTKLIPRLSDYPTIIDQSKFDEIQRNDENKTTERTGEKRELFASLSGQPTGEYLRQILRNFESVPFERFYIVGRSIWAHTDMIVKWKWLNGTGKPVVAHSIAIIQQTMRNQQNTQTDHNEPAVIRKNDTDVLHEEKASIHVHVQPITTRTWSHTEEKEQN